MWGSHGMYVIHGKRCATRDDPFVTKLSCHKLSVRDSAITYLPFSMTSNVAQTEILMAGSPEELLAKAKRRLEEYTASGLQDTTRDLFDALLEYGPLAGRESTVDWILSPRIDGFQDMPFDNLLQSSCPDKCDDEALKYRGRWFREFLINNCTNYPTC